VDHQITVARSLSSGPKPKPPTHHKNPGVGKTRILSGTFYRPPRTFGISITITHNKNYNRSGLIPAINAGMDDEPQRLQARQTQTQQ
jgi:hypothetical protein